MNVEKGSGRNAEKTLNGEWNGRYEKKQNMIKQMTGRLLEWLIVHLEKIRQNLKKGDKDETMKSTEKKNQGKRTEEKPRRI
ncbi:MAG: hypothetical protein LUE65_04180 [Clostridiales bacterium]|nr:hypothetical protein [Clostridiales bacterium]